MQFYHIHKMPAESYRLKKPRNTQVEALIDDSAFFPSCTSVALARSSHNVVLMNELSRCISYVPPWGVESGVRTFTQSEVLSGQTTKETQKQSKTTNPTPTKPSENRPDQDSSNGASNLCANEFEILHRNKRTPPDHIARSCEDVQ